MQMLPTGMQMGCMGRKRRESNASQSRKATTLTQSTFIAVVMSSQGCFSFTTDVEVQDDINQWRSGDIRPGSAQQHSTTGERGIDAQPHTRTRHLLPPAAGHPAGALHVFVECLFLRVL